MQGTRVPASDVAALVRDGIPPDQIGEFYPGVTAEAARDAADSSEYVDSYGSSEPGRSLLETAARRERAPPHGRDRAHPAEGTRRRPRP
ncbi:MULTISPECIES: DUF433 domain-containing protein [unclassified Streptomyces]|uniref:DUF433 domain-containing protein n=1 Tax=unclassified Streptomyces TaxID=2593676 RepID=UPI002254A19D|nr:DUF433 domain-containing protein [Streptomyces sp. NBC_01240]MCX4799475.1 DUF433 domain-containing protein [Streptomyces sp. NBC_01242]WSP59849.1 DUF433 domain-containing protein [Streptomyces sp. NBC_01241]WSP67652.1 DUF433 domain-containing protein [Streptomyces sp. NBC_01240]WSU26730.1 DUF433 domain-containing protein [Streptomyces sp. NBC_01108]